MNIEDILSNPNTKVYTRTILNAVKTNFEPLVNDIVVVDLDEPMPIIDFDPTRGFFRNTSTRTVLIYRHINNLNKDNLHTLNNRVVKIAQVYHPKGIEGDVYRNNESFTDYIIDIK